MSKLLQIGVMFFAPMILQAADSFVGDWKLDPQKSVMLNGEKVLAGRVLFTRSGDGDGYVYREAIDYGPQRVVTRSVRIHRVETVQRLNDTVFRSIRDINEDQFEVVYTHSPSGKPFCTFRYTVYPQIGTLIVTISQNDEPIQTLVFNKH